MSKIEIGLRQQLLENVKLGNEGIIPVKGVSMEPTLYEGDILFVQRQASYQEGDIVVFSYLDEGYLVHRIIGIDNGAILCKGDNARRIEVIMKRQIIGKVMRFISGGQKNG